MCIISKKKKQSTNIPGQIVFKWNIPYREIDLKQYLKQYCLILCADVLPSSFFTKKNFVCDNPIFFYIFSLGSCVELCIVIQPCMISDLLFVTGSTMHINIHSNLDSLGLSNIYLIHQDSYTMQLSSSEK